MVLISGAHPEKPAFGAGEGLSEGAGHQLKDSLDRVRLHLTHHPGFYGFLNQLVVPKNSDHNSILCIPQYPKRSHNIILLSYALRGPLNHFMTMKCINKEALGFSAGCAGFYHLGIPHLG